MGYSAFHLRRATKPESWPTTSGTTDWRRRNQPISYITKQVLKRRHMQRAMRLPDGSPTRTPRAIFAPTSWDTAGDITADPLTSEQHSVKVKLGVDLADRFAVALHACCGTRSRIRMPPRPIMKPTIGMRKATAFRLAGTVDIDGVSFTLSDSTFTYAVKRAPGPVECADLIPWISPAD